MKNLKDMSDKELNILSEAIQRGLDKAFYEMLKLKAALSQNIVIADSEGNPIEVPAKEVLDSLVRAEKGNK